ncbi:DHH family phosphoesterase [Salinibaculum rarum]|uniref:DHH family phosphoesterase n=1 Tax=Salinibaculum rarum TaxID=3058903 RepID=UPI00265E6FB3|nr:OB-fold nucleic acid binding domain-containing protein [Salinibaculum sp. KK48]
MSPPNGTGNAGTTAPEQRATVYDLAADCTLEDLEEGARYHATVNGVMDYGVFVDVSDRVSGLVHSSNLIDNYEVGEDLIVELTEILPDGDVSFSEVQLADAETEPVGHGAKVDAAAVAEATGQTVHLDGQVVQIKQTGGPTIFQVRGERAIVPCAAFEEAGVRAHPDIELDDIVRVTGTVESREGAAQIEVDDIRVLDDEDATDVSARLDAATEDLASPAEVDPLADWPAFEKLRGDLQDIARRLRTTILEGRPIRMRHHADGDGLCASVPLQYALEEFIEEVYEDPDAARHLLKRLPSKAPFYEMEDVTRDLNYALEDRKRHGQKLPLLLMLDNGSTEEDTPAYQNLAHYDVPILVVDHHHPDPEVVEPLVDAHVNPYLHDEDYRITTGMMSVEIARMIAPDLTSELEHVPAVAGLSDRSEGEAMPEYIDLAKEAGYEESRLRDIGEALDYATFWLRYNDGREFINDVLNVNCDDRDRHEQLVDLLVEGAESDVEDQLDGALAHVETEDLDNGAHLYRLDVENHAKRFTYPAPGKTTGKVHDRKVAETGDPVITIGYGPDFAVLRSDGVRLDIPQMVTELTDELPGAGVSGGGHLVVGSIKFVKGRREEVLDALVEKMSEAEIDEDLQSSAALPDDA